MKCFYHNDIDGKCAAFWVHNTPQASDEFDRTFLHVNYDRDFPLDRIREGEMVWIVDFSVEPDQMRTILERCGSENVFWIDHHRTAIDKFEGFGEDIQGVRDSAKAACELTFEYVSWLSQDEATRDTFENSRNTFEAPLFTKLIADRDIWKWEFGKATKYFFAGAQLLDLRPFSEEWKKLAGGNGYCESVQQQGKLIERFRARERRISITYFGYVVEFEGHQCMAVNGPTSGDLGQDIRGEGYDVAIVYRFNNTKQWTVSLYSKEVDVSVIARKYGGGGHRGAAGFQLDKDPNTLWKIIS